MRRWTRASRFSDEYHLRGRARTAPAPALVRAGRLVAPHRAPWDRDGRRTRLVRAADRAVRPDGAGARKRAHAAEPGALVRHGSARARYLDAGDLRRPD